MVTREQVQRWLDGYVEAWRSYDPARIAGLFAEDADYRYHPWDEPVHGRETIVADWLAPNGDRAQRDDPRRWHAQYAPIAVDGDLAIVTGTSTYLAEDGSVDRLYHNLWVLRFDETGRCRDFTEWYMTAPETE